VMMRMIMNGDDYQYCCVDNDNDTNIIMKTIGVFKPSIIVL